MQDSVCFELFCSVALEDVQWLFACVIWSNLAVQIGHLVGSNRSSLVWCKKQNSLLPQTEFLN